MKEMLIDSHHHLWKYNHHEYGWMDDSMDLLRRDYLPGDLEPQLQEAGVTGTVVVQARQTVEETRWLLDLAGQHPFILGAVGWVDLCSADCKRQLEELSRHPGLVGVRHVIHDEPDDDFMLRPEFTRGIGMLHAFRLAYDLLLFPRHLKNACKLAERFPGQRFVLDHLGKPTVREGILHPWKEDLEELALHPNIWCKVSGMVTEARLNDWKYEDFVPFLETVLGAFGPGRIMLGSDWPVCRLAGEYGEVMSIPARYFSGLSTTEKEKICWQNASEFYNLHL